MYKRLIIEGVVKRTHFISVFIELNVFGEKFNPNTKHSRQL